MATTPVRTAPDPDPSSGQYRTVVRFRRGEEIRSAVLPGLALPVDAVLGPRV